MSNPIDEDKKIYTPADKNNIYPFPANKQKIYPALNNLILRYAKTNSAVLKSVSFKSSKHLSVNCVLPSGLSIEESKNILMKSGTFFKCLVIKKHSSRFCKRIKCHGNHNSLFCYKTGKNEKSKEKTDMSDISILANESLPNTVYLQTLHLYIRNSAFKYIVRVRTLLSHATFCKDSTTSIIIR